MRLSGRASRRKAQCECGQQGISSLVLFRGEALSLTTPPWSPSSGVRPSFAVLLLLSAAWLLALLSVNSDTLLFHYLFAACNCIQVVVSPGSWEAQEDGVWG